MKLPKETMVIYLIFYFSTLGVAHVQLFELKIWIKSFYRLIFKF